MLIKNNTEKPNQNIFLSFCSPGKDLFSFTNENTKQAEFLNH